MKKEVNYLKSKLSLLNSVGFIFLTYLSLDTNHGMASSSSRDSGEDMQLAEQPKILSQDLSAVLFPRSFVNQVINCVDSDGYIKTTEKVPPSKTKLTVLDRNIEHPKFKASWKKFHPLALNLFQVRYPNEKKRHFSSLVWTHVTNTDNFPKNWAAVTLFMKSLDLSIDTYGIYSTYASNTLPRVIEDHPFLQSNLPFMYDVYNRTLITRMDDVIKITEIPIKKKITSLLTVHFPESEYVKESDKIISEEKSLKRYIKDHRFKKSWNEAFPIAYKLFTTKAPGQKIDRFLDNILDLIHNSEKFPPQASPKYLFMTSLGLPVTFENLRIEKNSLRIISNLIKQEHPLLELNQGSFIYDVYNKIRLTRTDSIVSAESIIGKKRTRVEAGMTKVKPVGKRQATLMDAAASIILFSEQLKEFSCPTLPAKESF